MSLYRVDTFRAFLAMRIHMRYVGKKDMGSIAKVQVNIELYHSNTYFEKESVVPDSTAFWSGLT